MVLWNRSKSTHIASVYQIHESWWKKAHGLMFRKQQSDYALIFRFEKEEKVPLHMFFVFHPIDVLFLNKEKRVVEFKEDFRPWKMYSPENKAAYIIEAPSGSINKAKVELNDEIDFFED